MCGQSEELRVLAEAFYAAFPDDYSPEFIFQIEAPTMREIIGETCVFYGVKFRDVCHRKCLRRFDISWSRHVAAYLCRTLTGHSHGEIMNAMGGFDHSISRYGWKRVTASVARDERVRDDIDILRFRIADAVLMRVGRVTCH